jgi:ferredoxin
MVCPTCYCFDAREEVELSLAEGKRVRVWDGCMLEDFAVVADGHNFRKDKSARFRHRIFRKGKTLPEKYGYFGCVGCGRCANACTADIAGPVKVFNYMEENK